MTIQSSGKIRLTDIAAEFGGTPPYQIQDYYRGGGLVPESSLNASIPTSGKIKLSDFYGSRNVASESYTLTVGLVPSGYGYTSSSPNGDLNPDTYMGAEIKNLTFFPAPSNFTLFGNGLIVFPEFSEMVINGISVPRANWTKRPAGDFYEVPGDPFKFTTIINNPVPMEIFYP